MASLNRVEKDAPSPDGTLPALRGLAKLADFRPIICIDTREIEPLTFTRLQSVRGTLYSGDYSILGLEAEFAVERKSLDDLANCCLSSNRGRFQNELPRLPVQTSPDRRQARGNRSRSLSFPDRA
jgi:ERCC4-type nuclease